MFREVALYLYCICIDHHFTNSLSILLRFSYSTKICAINIYKAKVNKKNQGLKISDVHYKIQCHWLWDPKFSECLKISDSELYCANPCWFQGSFSAARKLVHYCELWWRRGESVVNQSPTFPTWSPPADDLKSANTAQPVMMMMTPTGV